MLPESEGRARNVAVVTVEAFRIDDHGKLDVAAVATLGEVEREAVLIRAGRLGVLVREGRRAEVENLVDGGRAETAGGAFGEAHVGTSVIQGTLTTSPSCSSCRRESFETEIIRVGIRNSVQCSTIGPVKTISPGQTVNFTTEPDPYRRSV